VLIDYFKDGKEDGLHKAWYENGQLEYEGNYKDGKRDGSFRSWNENGQLEEEWNYKDGKLISEKWWDKEGKVVNVDVKNKEEVNKEVGNTGCIEGDCENGQGTYTWANGDKYVGEWKDDKRDNGKQFDKEDKLVGIWVDGNLHTELGSEEATKRKARKDKKGRKIKKDKTGFEYCKKGLNKLVDYHKQNSDLETIAGKPQLWIWKSGEYKTEEEHKGQIIECMEEFGSKFEKNNGIMKMIASEGIEYKKNIPKMGEDGKTIIKSRSTGNKLGYIKKLKGANIYGVRGNKNYYFLTNDRKIHPTRKKDIIKSLQDAGVQVKNIEKIGRGWDVPRDRFKFRVIS